MDIEKWLEGVRKLDELINAKLAERDRLNELATDISAKPFDGMPHSNTGMVSQKMQNAVVNLVILSSKIDKLIDLYIDYKQEVIDAIEKLPANEYGVLHRYYIRYMTQEQIAVDMCYCTSQIWRIKKKALKNLEDAVECNVPKWYNSIVESI